MSKVQPIPPDWTFRQQYKLLGALNFIDEENYVEAHKLLQELVDSLIHDDKGNLIEINEKPSQWLATYSDILIRLGLLKCEIENTNSGEKEQKEETENALKSGYSIPFGQASLKDKCAL
jgi:hypothetical protein